MKGIPFFSLKLNKMFSRASFNSLLVFILLVVWLAVPSQASAAAVCIQLTLNHTTAGVLGGVGGSDPSASPDRSTGCAFHKYHAGEIITLTATPNLGWSVGGWSGTNNNGSTSTTNTLTMPTKRRTVNVNYVQACYPLTRTHTGQGVDPAASPTESVGCQAGSYQYHQGQVVNLTASPAVGSEVLNWTGTDNDASNSLNNTVTMQAAPATVAVNYIGACHVLTLSHNGNGTNPVASPASSSGCPSGQYRLGETIELDATPGPDSGWTMASWIGADDNTNTALTNTLTMPNSDHTVTINYVEDLSGLGCYYLTATHIGSGSDPVPSPLKSAACPTDGYYVSGELINLTATPATGYVIAHWSGTDNDSLTTSANTWTMETSNHVAAVGYAKVLTLTRLSAGATDGWVLESTETSAKGGTLNAAGTTFNLGDDASDRQFRSILSFSTSTLPDNAKILAVTLKIRPQGQVGSNPFLTHSGLKVDIRKPFFGSALGLQLADFQALAGLNNVSTFVKTPTNGWYVAKLSSASLLQINLVGVTQLRLRFAKDDNDNLIADYMKFYSGNAATSTDRPQLVIRYYVP
jgi:hypothetical protein